MKLRALRIAGFGRLSDHGFDFAPGLNVVFGPNESGKSTVANAIVATLYGLERKKDQWRPWNGGAFATTLVYELANGERIEVQRDFDRDTKGVRVYDRSGNDIAARVGNGKKLVPGEAHLGVPLDVFLNAACVRQQHIAVDEGKDARDLAAHLARALDGGPREDAALGAVKRLDDALRAYVGTDRARKNAPLRDLRAAADEQQRAVDEARVRLEALDDLRARIERAVHERMRLNEAAGEVDRRARSLRAGTIRSRLAALREFREEFAELQAARSAFDDVAGFASDRETEIDDAYHAWDAAETIARSAANDAAEAQLRDEERRELEARRVDAGSLDDTAFAALQHAAGEAAAARARASAAAHEAAAARRGGAGAKGFLGGVLAGGTIALGIAVGFAIAHVWQWTAVALTLAVAMLAVAFAQGSSRAACRREAERKQHLADDALAAERIAAAAVAAVIDPLGLASIEALARARERLAALEARERAAAKAAERARVAATAAAAAAAHFDRLAQAVVPDITGERAGLRAAVRVRAARKRERDGLDAHLGALEMRKANILGDEDEYALEAELEELVRAGVEPIADDTHALRLIDAERAEIGDHLRAAGEVLARLEGELRSAEAHVADLASLDEDLARTHAEIDRLAAFERAVTLAKSMLELRTQEAHRAFARRLEDYAAGALAAITGGRYGDVFVDPATLAIRVRVPESGAIVDLESLSAGTRDQAYLVVRFAMARMFAEGIETPPLLLDDPFAYWDAERIERCLPIIIRGASEAQAVLFTASEELAAAAVAGGAQRINLSQPALL